MMSAVGDYYGGQERSSLLYKRDEEVVILSIRGMTNHEMRDILVGLWLRLDDDDKRDHVRALTHYLEPGSTPPYVSRQIAELANLKMQ